MRDLLTPLVAQVQREGHFPTGGWRPLWQTRDKGKSVALVFPEGGGRPGLVVKLEPTPGRGLAHERKVLDLLHARGDQFRGEVPRVLAWQITRGYVLLAIDALPGRPLKRMAPWHLRRAVSVGVDWLVKLNRTMEIEWVEGKAGWNRHVRQHLDAYQRNYVVSPRAGRALWEALVDSFPGARVPVTLRHGDFNTANVLWQGGREQGGIGVIDWELSAGPDPLGPDLVYWLHSCQPGRVRVSERRFRRAFFTPGLSARAARRYFDALGVAPALRWPLFLLGWIIQANDKRAWLPDDLAPLDDQTANENFALAYVSRGMCMNVEWACAWREQFAVGPALSLL